MHNHSSISTVRVRVRRPLTEVVGGPTNSHNVRGPWFPLTGGGFLSRSRRVSLPIKSIHWGEGGREQERGREEDAPEGTGHAGLPTLTSLFPRGDRPHRRRWSAQLWRGRSTHRVREAGTPRGSRGNGDPPPLGGDWPRADVTTTTHHTAWTPPTWTQEEVKRDKWSTHGENEVGNGEKTRNHESPFGYRRVRGVCASSGKRANRSVSHVIFSKTVSGLALLQWRALEVL
jgi:hypothetical protein